MATLAHRLAFESFGVVAEVASDDPARLEAIREVLPPGWRPADGPPQVRFEISRDGTITLDGREVPFDDEGVEPRLRLGSLVRHHLSELVTTHVFVHAGVVSAGGTTIVIPGAPHSGKTTLVAELVRAGATYHSDEYAPVDPAGLIAPYAKPLSVRQPGRAGPGAPETVPAEQVATEPARAGLVVITRYEEGAEWRPEEWTGGQGALALLEHAVVAQTRPAEALAAVSALARDARVLAGPRGEAEAVAGELLLVLRSG